MPAYRSSPTAYRVSSTTPAALAFRVRTDGSRPPASTTASRARSCRSGRRRTSNRALCSCPRQAAGRSARTFFLLRRRHRSRRSSAGDEPFDVAEDHNGEALAEAGEERDDAVEVDAFPLGWSGEQQPTRQQEIERDTEDGADER